MVDGLLVIRIIFNIVNMRSSFKTSSVAALTVK